MTSSVDLSPPRRPIFFPVVIATVFLTIIGMAGGFVLGERHRTDQSQRTQGSGPVSQPTADPSSAPTINGTPCPPAAQDAAAALGKGGLSQVLMIKTTNGSTIYICEDPDGRLYYQSHTRVNGEDAPLAQNVNGLFLPGVTSTDDGYVVSDQKKDKFVITRTSFQITFSDGRHEQYSVTSAVG